MKEHKEISYPAQGFNFYTFSVFLHTFQMILEAKILKATQSHKIRNSA
jgi:hypothetical protein